MLLPFVIAKAPRIWASPDARAMLSIYASQVAVLVTVALAFRFLVLG